MGAYANGLPGAKAAAVRARRGAGVRPLAAVLVAALLAASAWTAPAARSGEGAQRRREAHARGIKTDAWLVDFAEGSQGAAFREHPEWAQLNPDGGTTLTEKLGQA